MAYFTYNDSCGIVVGLHLAVDLTFAHVEQEQKVS